MLYTLFYELATLAMLATLAGFAKALFPGISLLGAAAFVLLTANMGCIATASIRGLGAASAGELRVEIVAICALVALIARTGLRTAAQAG